MKQTIINKLIMPLALFTGLGLAACKTPKGQAFSDFLGHTIADEVVRESIKKEMGHKDYREEENVYQGAQQRRNNNLPENVVWNGQKYRPAPGYTWVDPNNQNDLRVVRKERIQRYNELPLIFTCTGGINTGGNYKDVGTQIIFYPDQKKHYVIGKAELFRRGNEFVNINECLTTGEKFDPHKKTRRIEDDTNHVCIFSTEGGIEYARKHGYSTTLWKNTWYVDGKEIGSVTYALVDKEMLKQQRLESRDNVGGPKETLNHKKRGHGEETGWSNLPKE